MIVMEPLSADEVQARRPDEICADLQRRMKAMALSATVPPRHFVPERDGFWDGFSFTVDERFAQVFQAVELHRRSTLAHRTLDAIPQGSKHSG